GQKTCDHARRSSVEKRIDGLNSGCREFHVHQVALQRCTVAHRNGTDARHPFESPRAGEELHLALEVGKGRPIEVRRGRFGWAFFGDAGKPVLDVSGVAHLGRFTVADNIDADFDLPADNVGDRALDDRVRGLIELAAALAPLQEFDYGVGPGDRRDVAHGIHREYRNREYAVNDAESDL